MPDSKKTEWNKLSDTPLPLRKEVYFLWTDPFMYGHIERGYGEEISGCIVPNYVFIGAVQPTHWFPVPEVILPPIPIIEDNSKISNYEN